MEMLWRHAECGLALLQLRPDRRVLKRLCELLGQVLAAASREDSERPAGNLRDELRCIGGRGRDRACRAALGHADESETALFSAQRKPEEVEVPQCARAV